MDLLKTRQKHGSVKTKETDTAVTVSFSGSSSWARTKDLLINSLLLFHERFDM